MVAEWLKRLEVIESFAVLPIGRGRDEYEVRVRAPGSGQEVLLTDVGFGVSQVLPVVTQCFYSAPGSTLILEQPEIHLHPAVQAGLADLFIEAAAMREDGAPRNLQFIVESHSEHLLRRLLRRIAEAAVSPEEVAAYFVRSGPTASILEPLDVDELGNVRNWPKNFFGDQTTDIVEQTATLASDVSLRPLADVVDTNVPLVAKFPNGHPQELVDACEELLEDIIEHDRVVVTDENDEIIEEYFHQLSRSGQDTLGDAFAKWVFDRRWTWDASARPNIDPRGAHVYGVLEGDHDDFDPSDRKFVAVAKVSRAPVQQATDTKWLDWGDALRRHGVVVSYVHEPSIRAAYRAKFGRDAP